MLAFLASFLCVLERWPFAIKSASRSENLSEISSPFIPATYALTISAMRTAS